MRGKRLAWLALMMVVVIISACNTHTELPTNPQGMIQAGQPLFQEHCAACHQKDGSGQANKVPRLAHNPMVTLEDPVPIITIVVNGKGSMPAFGEKLDPTEIAQILSYIRNAWGNQAPAVSERELP